MNDRVSILNVAFLQWYISTIKDDSMHDSIEFKHSVQFNTLLLLNPKELSNIVGFFITPFTITFKAQLNLTFVHLLNVQLFREFFGTFRATCWSQPRKLTAKITTVFFSLKISMPMSFCDSSSPPVSLLQCAEDILWHTKLSGYLHFRVSCLKPCTYNFWLILKFQPKDEYCISQFSWVVHVTVSSLY